MTTAAPPSPVVDGPSFPPAIKFAATLLMAGILGWGLSAVQTPAWRSLGVQGWLFLALVAAVIGSGYWGILTSRTRIDEREIRQTWLWHEAVALTDITQIKLIQVRGLEAIVVPRLVVRSSGLGLTTFQAGSPAVVAAFRRLAYAEG